MKRTILIIVILFFCVGRQAYAFWLWSPKTKEWTNPKWSAKNTPQEQFQFAKEIFDAGDYKTASIEFRKLISHFPKSSEAAQAQFYIGSCLENTGKLYEAYLAYQKTIDKYAFTDKTDEILERQFNIADSLTGEEKKIKTFVMPQQYYAIEIFRKIIENSPYSKWAALSQYKIGLVLKSMGRFDEAKVEFEKLVSTYPESEWAEAAKYQVAQSASLASLKPDYDQSLTAEAKDKFHEFLKKHPDAELSQQAQEQIDVLVDKEAKKDFDVAQFYEKQNVYASAQIYYEDIIRKYPNSIWAQKSLERIEILEEENKL